MKKGTEYEILTQKIFQNIQNQKMVTNIEVKHNEIMEGKMTDHQIDVFWKFKDKNGIERTVIVESKDWVKPVDQEKLLAFKSLLNDLKCQPVEGVFVTRTGYQRGARKVAEASGIKLYELREPLETDWQGKIKTIVTESTFESPVIRGIDFILNEDWLANEKEKLDIPKEEPLPLIMEDISELMFYDNKHHLSVEYPAFMPQFVYHTKFYDENLEELYSLKNIIEKITSKAFVSLAEETSENTSVKERYYFEKPTFLITKHPKISKVKINAVEAKVSISRMTEKSKFNRDKYIKYILKNIIEGTDRMFSEEDFE